MSKNNFKEAQKLYNEILVIMTNAKSELALLELFSDFQKKIDCCIKLHEVIINKLGRIGALVDTGSGSKILNNEHSFKIYKIVELGHGFFSEIIKLKKQKKDKLEMSSAENYVRNVTEILNQKLNF